MVELIKYRATVIVDHVPEHILNMDKLIQKGDYPVYALRDIGPDEEEICIDILTKEHGLVEKLYLTDPGGYELIKLRKFIGCVDKDGTEIYEGDIIRDKSSGLLSVVVWIEKLAMFLCKPVEAPDDFNPLNYSECIQDMSFWNMTSEYCEVVGNVFMNPELLTEEEDKK